MNLKWQNWPMRKMYKFPYSFQSATHLDEFLLLTTDGFTKDIPDKLNPDEYIMKFPVDKEIQKYKILLKKNPFLKLKCECGCNSNWLTAIIFWKMGRFFPNAYGCCLYDPSSVMLLRQKYPNF